MIRVQNIKPFFRYVDPFCRNLNYMNAFYPLQCENFLDPRFVLEKAISDYIIAF